MLATFGWFERTISYIGTGKGPDSHGRQQWGILYNVLKYDTATSRAGVIVLHKETFVCNI